MRNNNNKEISKLNDRHNEWWRALIKNSINDFQNIKLKVWVIVVIKGCLRCTPYTGDYEVKEIRQDLFVVYLF